MKGTTISTERSSHRRCSMKKVVFKNFTIFAGKLLCWSLFLKRDFIKKRLQLSCYSVNIAKFLRTHILKNTWELLVLKMSRKYTLKNEPWHWKNNEKLITLKCFLYDFGVKTWSFLKESEHWLISFSEGYSEML